MRPNFEEPLDTAKQMVEKNITLYMEHGGEIWKQFLLESSITDYNILGENFIITEGWDHYWNLTTLDLIGAGTHAMLSSYLADWEEPMGKWYRSKETLESKYPYGGYLTNKNWHLNEALLTEPFPELLPQIKNVEDGYTL